MSNSTYYVPDQSKWPILASIALGLMAYGAAMTFNAMTADRESTGPFVLGGGFLILFYVIFGWFGQQIEEEAQGLHNAQLDGSYRQGMLWFIFSEVMFFAAFFGALFYVRVLSVPWIGGEGAKGVTNMLWDGFEATWPLLVTPDMKQFPGAKGVIDPWHLPLLNTALLITSSVTVTFAHHALKDNKRKALEFWMALTIILAAVFLYFQATEYHEAYAELGLTLESGIYGATFFMLTGFHGFHVLLGTVMLFTMLIRCFDGHFTPGNHFAFEAVCWYWHFVDVVWVGLFLFVYIL
ncbi:cytochrome c oxidase subunit 3 [Litorivicinus sp.]|jgi:cytochrome c oxidase subunit 3|nr:cytochrome c oxidase subunit 3 [Litorivicinus sp.]MDC1209056.1 cytochrome c oxidase subunit 3 [Litorivicinus sp.]MDC1240074.1 cytochrome c oxidase subunit 3 [Litorivicinus sp.]MDC1466241.1 cytochrome c oxidase subunit 3 [Litorivicinus sp.]